MKKDIGPVGGCACASPAKTSEKTATLLSRKLIIDCTMESSIVGIVLVSDSNTAAYVIAEAV